MTSARGKTESYSCRRCGDPFIARVADRNRGWARFCSKSCKAKEQESRTGQNAKFHAREAEREERYSVLEEGWNRAWEHSDD